MTPDKAQTPWKIYIDTGGTFTDCIARAPDGSYHRCKVLSSSALRGTVEQQTGPNSLKIKQEWNAPDNFINGFHFRLPGSDDIKTMAVENFNSEQSTLQLYDSLPSVELEDKTFEVRSDAEAPVLAARLVTQTPPGQDLPAIDMRLSTTKGTNALLERKGAKTLYLTTEGFGDLLLIRNQQRPNLFSLEVAKPDPFYTRILEIPERIDADGSVLKSPDPAQLEKILRPVLKDVDAVAVCLMNSYKNPSHEKIIKEYLEQQGVSHVSLSSELSPVIKIVPRAITTDVNAFLAPLMEQYIRNVSGSMPDPDLLIMTSAGGLTGAAHYQPKDGLLSGPAGGITGAAAVGKSCGINKLISFDMGGTSTDVARYDHGFEYRREHTVGDALLSAPSLSIETVAAGGGSICGFDGESLTAGPESAGAEPGPACYGSGGPLTITDVNLLTGRLDPSNFHFPVDLDAAKDAFHELFLQVKEKDDAVSGPGILQGLLDIANEKMAQAIKNISTAKGIDPTDYALVAFGGAGGQHATSIASALGIKKVLLPPDAGLLSAYGLEQARLEKIAARQCLKRYGQIKENLPDMFESLRLEAQKKLAEEGVPAAEQAIESQSIFMRLEGQESTLEIPWNTQDSLENRFRETYRSTYGHWVKGRAIEVEAIRIILAEKVKMIDTSEFEKKEFKAPISKLRSIEYRGNRMEMPVYRRDALEPGTVLRAPALILDPYSTLFAEPGWQISVRSDRTIELQHLPADQTRPAEERPDVYKEHPDIDNEGVKKDPGHHRDSDHNEVVKLQLYTNRFTSIAEEMGEMLRRTALSVNVKERYDFSCALLDSEGYLVANAPHIPVHLGAMGLCVRTLLEHIEMEEGDVILTNHPGFGGSHLPDITLVSPVFYNGERVGFAANRAHHAEIGGKSPGSMPPDATNLEEEGVVFPPSYLIQQGKGRWDDVRDQLKNARWPSRMVEENLADLQAAVAANHKGIRALLSLVDHFGMQEVTRYMTMLRSYAAGRMRNTLLKLDDGDYTAEEALDDGSLLKVNCRVKGDRVTFDFSGTNGTHPGNMNANPAIVNSVIIYVLRLMVDEPLPLNDGLLDPVDIILPECMLNPPFPEKPADCPAVVGGNIETSQRLVDTLLKAFGLAACSQGTMNNVLFGNDSFGYYETVAGGTGAGDGFKGADGVHQHMTNTRATDPEILEHRYPVRLDRFAIRPDSCGRGRWAGGNGLIREMTFLEPVQLSVLTQHRVVSPYGLNGGETGQTGNQRVIRADGSETRLKWKDAVNVAPGDRFVLQTPGGGGFGNA